jgi:carbon monoxide dehydrogenase subunit G
MELTNDFRVGVPPETAWAVLTDVERIAPCMPGAQLQEVEGDEYRGVVKVKVGPITAQYKGVATFLERDEAGRRAVLRAEGRDTRGQGNANATITATLTPDGDGTRVSVVTDLTVTGKVAQFGRGVMADVSAKLLDQFVACLESTVLTADAAPAKASSPETPPAAAAHQEPTPTSAPAAPTEPSGARRIEGPEAQPIDLLDTAGGSVAKRAGPVLVVIALLWLLRVLIKRRKK